MTLTLVRLRPDAERFVAWAARRRYLPTRGDDLGYALHAALKATLGACAPQPFAWRDGADGAELLGYSGAAATDIASAAQLPSLHDPAAAAALRVEELEARAMPNAFRKGQLFSFEVRVRPVVLSRGDAQARAKGSRAPALKEGRERRRYFSSEVDALFWRRARGEGDVTHERAYEDWLRARLKAGGARLSAARLVARSSVAVLRRPASDEGRKPVSTPGPAALFRGALEVEAPEAFASLLARGVGRHRAFGFGMLLLAPPGAL